MDYVIKISLHFVASSFFPAELVIDTPSPRKNCVIGGLSTQYYDTIY